MNIFYRLFSLSSDIIQSNEELINLLINNIIIIWGITSKNLEDKNTLIIFNSYFASYGEIINLYFKTAKAKIYSEFLNIFIFINKKILISGEKYLNIDENNINPHRIACILMKLSTEISIKEINNFSH